MNTQKGIVLKPNCQESNGKGTGSVNAARPAASNSRRSRRVASLAVNPGATRRRRANN